MGCGHSMNTDVGQDNSSSTNHYVPAVAVYNARETNWTSAYDQDLYKTTASSCDKMSQFSSSSSVSGTSCAMPGKVTTEDNISTVNTPLCRLTR